MATVRLNPMFNSISGRLGDVVYRRRGGVTYASRCPRPSTRPPSPAQLAQRERFAEMSRARAAEGRMKQSDKQI